MSDKNVSWEDRVVALELEAKHERERRAAVEKTVAERDATITSLKSAVDEGKKREEQRRKAEIDGYVGGLKAKAAAKGCAIEEPKLAHVTKLLEVGMDAEAHVLGDTLLANATAGTQSGSIIQLGAGGGDPAAETDGAIADALRANGWKVELDAKGRITSKTPPQKAGR